ncbi:DUF4190 domain-containing protein [Arthrobacter sp. M4]|uniref:DUF4190 domain-containing protein n=1 Tax=Arthrobacter sp. M4 TaxID=218160 RepID=UPI001CDD2ECE|nr:DUF4190 domain-containing protein [Arthrobacter sp. M4]MCA4135513.1 DUF4190 domain-containing protein [Arthrobacter sp. M4]
MSQSVPGSAPGGQPNFQPTPYEYPRPTTATVPGKTLGIVGFVLSLLGPLTTIGLILSIVALVQSRKARANNGFAIAGIIIGALGTIAGALILITTIAGLGFIAQQCAELGPGVHYVNNVTITCS